MPPLTPLISTALPLATAPCQWNSSAASGAVESARTASPTGTLAIISASRRRTPRALPQVDRSAQRLDVDLGPAGARAEGQLLLRRVLLLDGRGPQLVLDGAAEGRDLEVRGEGGGQQDVHGPA